MTTLKKIFIFLFTYCHIQQYVSTSTMQPNNAFNISTTGRETGNKSFPVCNKRPNIFYKVTSSLLLPFIPVTVLGNALVCIVVYVSPIFYKQPSYILISSLAVADVLVGMVSMPIKAKIQWNHPYFCLPEVFCWIYMLEEITFSVASATHLFAIAAERYIGLKYPYQYKTVISRKRTATLILCLWFFSISCGLLSIFKWSSPRKISIYTKDNLCYNDNREFFTSLYIVVFIIPTAFMSFIYHFIYKTSARHINEITKLDVLNSPTSREKGRRNRYFRMVRSITIVFAVYTLCWIPMVIFIFLTYYLKANWRDHVHTEWFKTVYFMLVTFLPVVNSMLNPFIYVISNAEFRYVVYRLLFRKSDNDRGFPRVIRKHSRMVSNNTANLLEMVSCGTDRLEVSFTDDNVEVAGRMVLSSEVYL